MKEHLQTLDTLNINLGSNDMVLVNFILAFVMFGVALSIRVSTFKSILKKPKSVTLGLLLQWFALPALTCLLAIALNPFITPLNFWFWGTHYCQFAEIRNKIPTLDIPFDEMLSQIVLILGFPIVLGLVFSHYFPKISKKIIKPTQVLSILFFIAMVIVSMTQVLSGFEQKWEVYAAILCTLVIVVIHNFTALATGYYGGKLAKAPVKDCRTLAIEIGIQNSGLALALLFNTNIFTPGQWRSNGGMIIVAALWGIWHIISGLIISRFFRRSKE